MRRRDEPAVRSRGVEPVARCKRCGLPALEPSEQCRCPDGEDDKITAAKLKADGWDHVVASHIPHGIEINAGTFMFCDRRDVFIGQSVFDASRIRTVTGMDDLRALTACLRGEKK